MSDAIPQLDSQRRGMVQDFLRENELGGWIGWRPEELVLLLGHMPHWGVSVCLYPREGAPLLVLPELEPRDHLPPEVEVLTYGWGRLECADPWTELAEILRNAIASRRLAERSLGYAGHYGQRSPSGCFAETPPFSLDGASLLANIAGKRGRDCSSQFQKLYWIKSEGEIAAIRLANQVAVRALDEFQKAVAPGRTEAELAAVVEGTILRETGLGGVYLARGIAFVQSGIESAAAGRYNRNTGRKIEAGDAVLIELATCVNGYWSDLTRTQFAGEPRSEHRQMFEAVRVAQELAIAAVRPGIKACEIDSIARRSLETAGYGGWFTHATGHHTGFRYHDPGPTLAPGVVEELKPGMILTVEPGIYSEQLAAGVRIEDNILVTATGSEKLSQAPANTTPIH